MDMTLNRQFGAIITKLIQGNNLTEKESFDAFSLVLNDEISQMQQGAFLASLTAKGETAQEIAGGWRAIYEYDTNKVSINGNTPLIDNCGTGMDSFKTFNISTAASIIASSGGLKIARHGARAISSTCGTVDISENLGVDIECPVDIIAQSIENAGLGLFNGMSPEVHPQALGRILSQIHFGSPLNIAASLANPALPQSALRGVYSRELMEPVLQVMQKIGYTNVIVIHGTIGTTSLGIDEASTCGSTFCLQLHKNTIKEFAFTPEEVGLQSHDPIHIAAQPDLASATHHLLSILAGKLHGAALDVVCLNSSLLFLLAQKVATIEEGIALSKNLISSGAAIHSLRKWVEVQNRNPTIGRKKLDHHLHNI